MAVLTMHANRLHHNYHVLDGLFKKHNATWSIVTKLLCGHKDFTRELLSTGINAVCDSRMSNIRMVRRLEPDSLRMYIKPPPKNVVRGVVETCHVSFNSELRTITWLSEAARELNVHHGIMVMVEGGDLREGVSSDEVLLALCEAIVKLPNVSLMGIGTNFNCMSGVLPSPEALERLLRQARMVENHLGQELTWVSAGSSVVIPSLLRGEVPAGMNHWRIGESLFFGNDLVTGETLPNMQTDVFTVAAEILEIGMKQSEPEGEMSRRAIVNLGVLDIGSTDHLTPMDPGAVIAGSSSDMIVVDITNAEGKYTVGGTMSFRPGYFNTLSLMNSRYVEKRVVGGLTAGPSHRRALQATPEG